MHTSSKHGGVALFGGGHCLCHRPALRVQPSSQRRLPTRVQLERLQGQELVWQTLHAGASIACRRRWSDVLHDRSCSIHCWNWRNEIHDRTWCGQHCRRWRGVACRWSDVLHDRSWCRTCCKSRSNVFHDRSWCGEQGKRWRGTRFLDSSQLTPRPLFVRSVRA